MTNIFKNGIKSIVTEEAELSPGKDKEYIFDNNDQEGISISYLLIDITNEGLDLDITSIEDLIDSISFFCIEDGNCNDILNVRLRIEDLAFYLDYQHDLEKNSIKEMINFKNGICCIPIFWYYNGDSKKITFPTVNNSNKTFGLRIKCKYDINITLLYDKLWSNDGIYTENYSISLNRAKSIYKPLKSHKNYNITLNKADEMTDKRLVFIDFGGDNLDKVESINDVEPLLFFWQNGVNERLSSNRYCIYHLKKDNYLKIKIKDDHFLPNFRIIKFVSDKILFSNGQLLVSTIPIEQMDDIEVMEGIDNKDIGIQILI